jgi:hypothetical protein
MSNCTQVFVRGVGAVSPAGWGVPALLQAVQAGQPLPTKELARPGWNRPLRVRQVPTPAPRPTFLGHPRLRRTSPVSQFAAAAAIEALGGDLEASRGKRLGIVFCTFAGTMNYSRRFFDETLRDPATASPLIFPETVFNAPASHLAALLGSTGVAYTLMGDPGVFLQGIALAADWLCSGKVDACLVIGAEEMDWLPADAVRLFNRSYIMSEGAGALCLTTAAAAVELACVTDSHNYSRQVDCRQATGQMRQELAPNPGPSALLCDGVQGIPRLDRAELAAWADWPGARCSPKIIVGEGMAAAAAWQCAVAVNAVQTGMGKQSLVSIAGCNQQAIGAKFRAAV